MQNLIHYSHCTKTHKITTIAAFFLLGLILSASNAFCTTYYVDFDGGSDLNTGTSPQEAFQHAPRDAEATDNAEDTDLMPGDMVIFKGGVHYRGSFSATRAGSTSNPIIYDGNTAGDFGTGPAIIDGADELDGWTQCTSAQQCNGNPNWQNIWWTEIDPPANGLFHVNLCEGERYMAIAQDPNPNDQFYQDRVNTYVTIKSPIPATVGSYMEYADSSYFNQADADYWGDDAYIAIYCRTNRVYRLKVHEYTPASNKIRFDILQADQYPAGQGKFCMFNALTILDQPGEYYVKLTAESNGKHRIYAWPYSDVSNMSISKRHRGIAVSNSNIVIRGFVIQKQSNGAFPSAVYLLGSSARNVTVSDNEIRLLRQNNEPGQRCSCINASGGSNLVIANNNIHENVGMHGIAIDNVSNSSISGNTLIKCGATVVVCYGSYDTEVVNNTLRDNYGMHANGLTFYLGCQRMLIEGNRVSEGAAHLTAQDGGDFIIRNNIFDGNGSSTCIAFWALYNMYNVQLYHNTLVNAGSMGAIYGQNAGSQTDVLTVRNNIIDGTQGTLPGTFSHNIYTARGNHSLTSTELLVTDMDSLFTNPDGEDYHLLSGSAAVDMGLTTVEAEYDFDGQKRPCDAAPDAGAYEYQGLLANPGPDRIVADMGGDGSEMVTLDGSESQSPDSTITNWQWFNGSTFLGLGESIETILPQGINTITLKVIDNRGISNSQSADIEIRDMLGADAGDDQTVTDTDNDGSEIVSFDGTGSYDPNNVILMYLWYVDDVLSGSQSTCDISIPVGEHVVKLMVMNGSSEKAYDECTVTVLASSTTPGDANGDGAVNLDDFIILKQNYGTSQGATVAEGDFNDDGAVNLDDFIILKQNYGQ